MMWRRVAMAARTVRGPAAAGALAVLCVLILAEPALRAGPPERGAVRGAEGLPSVFVDLRATTWKPRGRVLFDVLAVIRNRLMDVGIPVVRSIDAPSNATLLVEYTEQQGEPIDVMSAQTIVTGRFLLQRDAASPLLDLTVREQTGTDIGGTPPYVDAIQRFESHPTVYFLGDLVRQRFLGGDDRAAALMRGLRRELEAATTKVDPMSAPHTMLESESIVPHRGRQRAIDELGTRGEVRAVPLLRAYLAATDPDTRRAAQHALARLAPAATPP